MQDGDGLVRRSTMVSDVPCPGQRNIILPPPCVQREIAWQLLGGFYSGKGKQIYFPVSIMRRSPKKGSGNLVAVLKMAQSRERHNVWWCYQPDLLHAGKLLVDFHL